MSENLTVESRLRVVQNLFVRSSKVSTVAGPTVNSLNLIFVEVRDDLRGAANESMLVASFPVPSTKGEIPLVQSVEPDCLVR